MWEYFFRKAETATADNFTSDLGLKFRRLNHKPFRYLNKLIHKKLLKYDIFIDRKVKLEKNKSYIFASSHYFDYDVLSIIASVDRNCYVLSGGLRTIPKFFLISAWINGGIYVNRLSKEHRKDSMRKMSRVLKAGNSILIYPEGVLNNSENVLCLPLFSGVYNLSLENEVEVVPVAVHRNVENKSVHVTYGVPLKLYDYEKEVGLQFLRDNITTLLYEQVEKYSTPLKRNELKGDIHFAYMNERMKEYTGASWKDNPVWESELVEYKPGIIDLEDVWKDIDKVNINIKNANIFGEILVELEKRKKYNFKNYIIKNYKNNFNKDKK